MTSLLDRRLKKLETSARIAEGEGAVHVVFVRPDEDHDEQVAKLGPIRPGDQLITVTFVRAADMQSPGTIQ